MRVQADGRCYLLTSDDPASLEAALTELVPAPAWSRDGATFRLQAAARPALGQLARRLRTPITVPRLADGARFPSDDARKPSGNPTPAPTTAPAGGSVTATRAGNFRVRFTRPTAASLAEVRAITGRDWDPKARQWKVPVHAAAQVGTLASRHGLTVDDHAAALIEAVGAEGRTPVAVRADGLDALVDLNPTPAQAETLNAIGARAGVTSWCVGAERADDLAAFLSRDDVATLTAVDDLLARFRDAAETLAAAEALHPPEGYTVDGLARELRPHQAAAVHFILERAGGSAFLCDKMGGGKTQSAIATIEKAGAYPAVCIVPATLKPNWRREWGIVAPHRVVHTLNGRRTRPWGFVRPDVVICNYDVLRDRLDDLVALQPAAVVADESDACRDPGTHRTKALIELGAAIPPGGLRLALTGTPIRNRPAEYRPQLQFLGRGDQFDLDADPTELNRQLRASGVMVRRTTRQLMPELGEQEHLTTVVEGSAKEMAEYRRAEADLLTYLAERAAALAAELGDDPDEAALRARIRAGAAEHLVAVTVLKRLAARAKMAAARDWIDQVLAEGSKVLVFAHHLDVVDELAVRFDAPTIKGGMTAEAKQAVVDRFQTDDTCRLAVLGLTAAGVGLTLTAADAVLFVEQGWTPAVHDQAVARAAARLNDPKNVPAVYLVAEGTIDEAIVDLIAAKRELVDAATDGASLETAERAGGSVLADLIEKLTMERTP